MADTSNKRKALGRGLASLIPEAPKPQQTENKGQDYFVCPIELISHQANQPRRYFDEEKLAELVESIKHQGIVQPLVVRPLPNGTYVLIAGERRWRAAQRAQLREVPVVIRNVDDLTSFEMALVENLQREDLNPIEEAEAYSRLIKEHHYTQEVLSKKLGKQRSTVANSIRLLQLPDDIRREVISGALSSGHARTLLPLENETVIKKIAQEIMDKNLSVRQTELLVKKTLEKLSTIVTLPNDLQGAQKEKLSPNLADLQERMSRTLGVKVRVLPKNNNKGRLEINYNSLDELDRVLEVLLP